mmetsp:Transcript_123444/g.193636  ORF Transcript_123444/g.193636 Transcript_123444/m.193636 type:complete len:596 (-) Transcript_123444:171-1958(-)
MATILDEVRTSSVELEVAPVLSKTEDAEINSHCADLQARLDSLRNRQPANVGISKERISSVRNYTIPDLASRFNVVETNCTEEAKIIEVHNINVVPRTQVQEIIRSKPVVQVQEQIRTVPKLEVKEVERVVEVPHIQYVNKFIEVPEVRVVEKIVEVPQVHIQEVVKEVPKVQVHEIIRHIPRIEVQEVLRPVPKIEVQVVEKTIEVPRIQTVEKIVEVPRVQTVEKLVQVPHYQTIEKIVPVEKIVQVEKPVYVNQPPIEKIVEKPVYITTAPVSDKVEVLECVTIGSTQVPVLAETLLTSMSSSKLREHAFLLYNTLGLSRLGSSVPVAQAELISWIASVQRQHLEPLRAKAPPPAGYQLPYNTAAALQGLKSGSSYPLAVAGVDTTHDGFPNFLYVGEDRNGDGIPDALQESAVKSGSIKSGSVVATPRLVGPDRSSVGRPLQQRALIGGATSSEVPVELCSRGGSVSLDQRAIGMTQCLGTTTTSIGTAGSVGAPARIGGSAIASSSAACSPSLGVTVAGRASGNQFNFPSSISAPVGTPRKMSTDAAYTRTEVPLRSQTPGRYRAGPTRSRSQLSRSGSSSAILGNASAA